MARRTVSAKLDTVKDGAVLSWLDSHENRSDAIRKALYAAMTHSHTTLDDVMSAVVRVERALSSGVILQAVGVTEDDGDDSEFDDALDAIGL